MFPLSGQNVPFGIGGGSKGTNFPLGHDLAGSP